VAEDVLRGADLAGGQGDVCPADAGDGELDQDVEGAWDGTGDVLDVEGEAAVGTLGVVS
jgi:hypothetical protein